MPRVIHFEIAADDPERAVAFYRQAFGWKIEKWEGPMEYWLVETGPADEPGIDGGLGRRTSPGEGTVNTIGVDDIDAALEKVLTNGGKVIGPKHAVPGVGWLAYCADTEGNAFGLMQDDPTAL
ncbi:MAG: VOC family protein [Chloroflexi bacterium]|nr:VOC family protein [Chloroflexota bacterium]